MTTPIISISQMMRNYIFHLTQTLLKYDDKIRIKNKLTRLLRFEMWQKYGPFWNHQHLLHRVIYFSSSFKICLPIWLIYVAKNKFYFQWFLNMAFKHLCFAKFLPNMFMTFCDCRVIWMKVFRNWNFCKVAKGNYIVSFII